jgi:hypothetical protein
MAGPSLAVSTEHLTETRQLLRKFDPDLLKRLDAVTQIAARRLKAGAESTFNKTGALGGYRIATRRSYAVTSTVVTTARGSVPRGERWSTAPGVLAAIFELMAGVRDAMPQNVKRVMSLVETLEARYGSPGRFLWDTWDYQKAETMAEIGAGIRALEDEYTAKLR